RLSNNYNGNDVWWWFRPLVTPYPYVNSQQAYTRKFTSSVNYSIKNLKRNAGNSYVNENYKNPNETPSLVRVNQFMIYEKRLSRNEFLNLGLEEVILPKTSIYPSRVDVSMYEGFMGPGVGIVGMFTNYRFQIDDEHI